jgi:signal transduction histidine kinase/ActR/RegA family two-component response regulator
MFEFLAKLFDTSDFTPRWMCGNWTAFHGWLHIVSDLATWGAYTAIPVALVYFVRKRQDVPFHRIFLLFGLFIVACGTTHLLEAIIFWVPIYRISGVVKLVTAVVSWGTFVALVQILPEAIKLPGIMKLNGQLQQEIKERQRIETEREALLSSEQAARAEAEQASRMKDEFLSTVSHEIRTPLNAILGWSQIMQRPGISPEDVAQGAEVIERNSRIQAKIIEDLLDMSRIVAGKVHLEVQPMDLASIVEAALQTVQPAASAKNIALSKNLGDSLGGMAGDPNRLQQVIWNLLSNAIKFTPKGGAVRIEAHRVNSMIEISVADSGIGIEPAFLPNVFDRFSQADGGTTRRYGGLGLGLAIVKQLVELHGGSVQAASPGAGQGATFTVRLPIRAIEAPAIPSPAQNGNAHAAATHANLQGLRVLVVDDEADARQLVGRLLAECGAAVTDASSADEALQKLSDGTYDILISDIGMPDRDGYFLIRKLRERESGRASDIPAIALTAFARSEDRRRILLAGFQSHVAKPAEPAELTATVASLTGRTQS